MTRGQDLPDLVRYLFGPGRANEHTNQRLIASHESLTAQGGPYFDEPDQLAGLAREIDAPRTLFDTEVRGGYVWHCSIALPPDDGELTDEQWARVAQRMVDAMGFSPESGKAQCRWVAVHHGKSTGGNDHVHLAVNLVREDGTKANLWQDKRRTQQVCADLEREMGLRIVEGRNGRSTPGIKRGEQEAAQRRGQPEPARRTLARRVRAASATAETEAEFVRNLRASGVVARPRYAAGGRTEVVGYSVALHTDGQPQIWFGGGKLGGDLTLSRLREQWPDSEPTAAVAAWSERSGQGVRSGADVSPWMRDESAWQMAARQVQDVRERLADVPTDDVVRWSQAAHEAAGVLAVLSARMEPNHPGPLARAADVLSRSAQRTREHRRTPLAGQPGQMRGASLVARHSRTGPLSALGEVELLKALRNTLRGIHRMHQARGELSQARQIEDVARGDLQQLQSRRESMRQSPGAFPPPVAEHERGRTDMRPRGPEHGR
ncbi:relaxase/mobilization nuclease domain-containing protein [Streptomyces chryseus]|uniref:relaxase/mobilization nuclease domain-containing protein n=1 Tax=Streptomyces chryseus TaxID=68186 RepID=UPI00142F0824|nr:relaxase/mobilization nuclease domain-containing protein [Streptomyces chryseus]